MFITDQAISIPIENSVHIQIANLSTYRIFSEMPMSSGSPAPPTRLAEL